MRGSRSFNLFSCSITILKYCSPFIRSTGKLFVKSKPAGGRFFDRFPGLFAFGKFFIGYFYIHCAGRYIDFNDISVLDQCQGSAVISFRGNVTDAETSGCSRKTTVSDRKLEAGWPKLAEYASCGGAHAGEGGEGVFA